VWSTTKGLTAACFAMLVSRGQLSYDTPVSEHWPEFARHGKQDVSVAMLLSHQAGLCGFRTPTTLEQLYDATTAAEHLAAMEPLWIPGEAHGYHALTMGYLANELFRRVDGRSIRQFVADELHSKHGLELYIGLPPEEAQRAAAIVAEPGFASAQPELELTKVQQAAMANPILSPTLPNTDGWRSAEIPSANGFATARALATLYGCMAVWLDLAFSTELVLCSHLSWPRRPAPRCPVLTWCWGWMCAGGAVSCVTAWTCTGPIPGHSVTPVGVAPSPSPIPSVNSAWHIR
jgi:CubicO group peptidase (beta-lactamase class C family)